MIVLPKGAFTVIPEKAEEKTKGGLILTEDLIQEPDVGMIAFTSEELNEYQGMKVRFRKSFSENLNIEGISHLYFRDFNSSIYYVIKD